MAVSRTKIEWCDATWSPVRGCSLVSAGCQHCYAMGQAHRFSGPGQPYEGLTKMTSHGPVWTGAVKLVPEALDQPLRWRRPRMVFVNSMSDLFHEDIPDEFIADVFAYMAYARQHTFQVLTKRPERMRRMLTDRVWIEDLYDRSTALAHAHACEILGARGQFDPNDRRRDDIRAFDPSLPLGNVWLGVSAEDQGTANERTRQLLLTPAAVRWVSAEPLLGPIDFRAIRYTEDGCECRWNAFTAEHWIDNSTSADCYGNATDGVTKLDWVVVGGESGPKARPMEPDWARSLRDQCAAAGTPFFFKQWGEATFITQRGLDSVRSAGFDRTQKKGGRMLDGVLHDAYPEVP